MITLPAPRATAPPAEIDLDVQKVVLDVVNRKIKGLDTRIDQSMTGGEVERTIQGASTLSFTVHDPKRILLQSGMFAYTVEVTLDTLRWRLVKVSKSADDLTLTFEDRAVSLLREKNSPKKASRAAMTRAEFAYSLVREVPGIQFYCPQLHVKQPIEQQKQQTKPKARKATRSPGINPGINVAKADGPLMVQGSPASATQIRNAERVLDVANSLNAPIKATQALLAACIDESGLQNLSYGPDTSQGILQVLSSTAANLGIGQRDIEACAHAFLTLGFAGKSPGGAIGLSQTNSSLTPGQIAQACQGSAYKDPYSRYVPEATKFMAAYTGTDPGAAGTVISAGGGGGAAAARTVIVPYQFTRGDSSGGREDTWTCIQRLAQEVNWRCFCVGDVVYFISDDTLMQAKPDMVLEERSPGVTSIDFDIDSGKVRDTCTITCRAARWAAAPGAVVELSGVGPASGRWLVSDMRRSLFSADATITLTRPSKALPEPAASTTTVAGSSSSTSAADLAAAAASGDKCSQVYQACQAMSAKQWPYVWDGGHASAGTPSTGAPGPGYTGQRVGFDCSGSTGAVLAAAGLGFQIGDPVPDSGTFARSWGEAGEGQCLTVWASDVHVWIEVKGRHFGTGSWPTGNGGPQLQQEMHPKSGFTPRHWPGT